MKVIIDTHIFLWAISEPSKLSSSQLEIIERRANTVYLSSISIAEIAIKASLGKLDVKFDPLVEADLAGLDRLDFSAEEAFLLKNLPFHHQDPFDRMLICQGLSNGIPIITSDPKFNPYDCKLI